MYTWWEGMKTLKDQLSCPNLEFSVDYLTHLYHVKVLPNRQIHTVYCMIHKILFQSGKPKIMPKTEKAGSINLTMLFR